MYLDQWSVRFFCKEPGNKYFWLCFAVLAAALRSALVNQIPTEIICEPMCCFLNKTYFTKWEMWDCSWGKGHEKTSSGGVLTTYWKNPSTQVSSENHLLMLLTGEWWGVTHRIMEDTKAAVSLKSLPQQERKPKVTSLEVPEQSKFLGQLESVLFPAFAAFYIIQE